MIPNACPTRPRSSCYPGTVGGSPTPNVIVTDEKGEVIGATPRTGKGVQCTISDMARAMCVLEEKFVSAAVAAGADTVFEIQLRWWWQINVWINVEDQDDETFALVNIQYGNDVPFFQTQRAFNGSLIDGVAYGAPNGLDIRRWNITSVDTHWYPTPANAWQDPVTYTWTNNNAAAQDLGIEASGPASLQLAS